MLANFCKCFQNLHKFCKLSEPGNLLTITNSLNLNRCTVECLFWFELKSLKSGIFLSALHALHGIVKKRDKILNLSSLVIFLLRKIKTSFLISFAHEKRNIYQKNIKPFMSKFDQKCLIFTSIKALKSDVMSQKQEAIFGLNYCVSTSPIWSKLSDISLLVVNPYVKHYFRSSQLHYYRTVKYQKC